MKNLTKTILLVASLIFTTSINAQTKNIFIERSFWKTNPTIKQVEQEISRGHSATKLNRYGFDAVVYALLENTNIEVIKYLLSKKGNGVNKLTHDGRTYIFWAAYKNNLPIVKHLLKNGAKTNIIDDKGYSVLKALQEH